MYTNLIIIYDKDIKQFWWRKYLQW